MSGAFVCCSILEKLDISHGGRGGRPESKLFENFVCLSLDILQKEGRVDPNQNIEGFLFGLKRFKIQVRGGGYSRKFWQCHRQC